MKKAQKFIKKNTLRFEITYQFSMADSNETDKKYRATG